MLQRCIQGGPAVIQTLIVGEGMAKRTILMAPWPVGLSDCQAADGTEQVSCSVLDCMARHGKHLNHSRLANDDPRITQELPSNRVTAAMTHHHFLHFYCFVP